MDTKIVVALALLALLLAIYMFGTFGRAAPQKCPITGVELTEQMLADPSLKVGNATMCCQGCVKTYRDQMRID
jgi:hypothetical protein